jgi:hypothetical protein
VRSLIPLLLLGWLLGSLPGAAQEKMIQDFAGTSALTTGTFQVRDKWEIRWDALDLIEISVFAPDGTLVAGAAASSKGSLYEPRGGMFYVQVQGASAWHVSVVELGSALAANPSEPSPNYAPPTPTGTNSISPSVAAQPAATPADTNSGTPPAAGLTEDQAHAIVVIKGDYGEGTGFLIKTKDGPAVVTNIHVLAANPHIKILTTTGTEIKALGLKGASDRDLAMFPIQDDHYSYLDTASDVAATVQTGDEVVTPGNSEGGEVVLNTKGEVVGIGPDKVEISNPIYHGNSGGPVFHLGSGKVIGVVEGAMQVRPSDEIDKASAANAKSAITGTMRYFALRLDTVPAWEPYDPDRFLAQTTFLKNFEELNRCIDSYLNGTRYEKAGLTSMNIEEGAPNSKYYLKNDKIRGFADNYHQLAADADKGQRLDAQRELVMDLEGQAELDLATIQDPTNFYSFEETRAKAAYDYRKGLQTELGTLENKLGDLGH